MLNRSGNTKRGSKGVTGCRDNGELLSSCTGEERRVSFKIVVSDSRGGMFRPLSVIKGVESVRKHETGLERGLWLLR